MVDGSEPALETEPAHLLAAVREFFWPLGDKARAHASPAASCLTPSHVARNRGATETSMRASKAYPRAFPAALARRRSMTSL